MTKPLAIFFADAHLDLHTWTKHPDLYGDSRYAFRRICRAACKLGVPLFGAGDLIDVRKPPSAVAEFVRQQMDNLQECGCPFYYTQGQHELSDPPWFAAVHDWPAHLHGSSVLMGEGMNVHGLDWQPADKLAPALEKIPKRTNILLCHQVWEEFMGDIAPCEGSLEQIPHAKVVFTGDYHQNEVTHLIGASNQDMKIISPGATSIRKIDEPALHYYYVLNDDRSWTRKRISGRPVSEFDIDEPEDLDRFCKYWDKTHANVQARAEKLPEYLRKPLLWIIYNPEVDDVRKRVLKTVGEDGVCFFKTRRVKGEEDEITRARKEVLERGVDGCLDLVVSKKDPRYKPLVRLLRSTNPKLELQQMRAELLEGEDESDASEGSRASQRMSIS